MTLDYLMLPLFYLPGVFWTRDVLHANAVLCGSDSSLILSHMNLSASDALGQVLRNRYLLFVLDEGNGHRCFILRDSMEPMSKEPVRSNADYHIKAVVRPMHGSVIE